MSASHSPAASKSSCSSTRLQVQSLMVARWITRHGFSQGPIRPCQETLDGAHGPACGRGDLLARFTVLVLPLQELPHILRQCYHMFMQPAHERLLLGILLV